MRWSGRKGPRSSHHCPASRANRATSSRSSVRAVLGGLGHGSLTVALNPLSSRAREGRRQVAGRAAAVSMKNRFLAGLGAGHAVAMGWWRSKARSRPGGASVPVGAQIRRDVGRGCGSHPQRRRPCEARGRRRPRLRRRGLGHGRPDQSARRLGRGRLGLQAEERQPGLGHVRRPRI